MEHYAKNIIVDFKETDRYLYLRLDSFLQMLNTVSMYHTVSLGFAPDYM
ncbi:MAG: acyl-ACP thioesterase, partial [Clostridium sp.]|nr:acyl-ACP thioesterase [Clostridium sp.]